MKYVVDHIIDNIIILENIETKEIIEINRYDIPFSVRDGYILIKDNNKYYLDKREEKKRRKELQEKLDLLKGDFL